MGFADSVRQNVAKVKQDTQNKCYAIVFSLFNNIVYSTPVLDGYLKNNWFTSPTAFYSSATTNIADPLGGGSLLNIESLRNDDLFYGRDSICTMANNLDYGYKIEYEGWSQYKAPKGMVRINLVAVAARNR